MELLTKHFGMLDIGEDDMIIFDEGLPGYPDDKRFIIIFDETAENKFYWLQSMDDGHIALMLIDSFEVMPEYDPLIDESEIEELEINDIEDLLVFNVVIIADRLSDCYVNLKAPIIINNSSKKGKQVIVQNEEYQISHKLEECIKNEGRVQPCEN